MTDVGRRFPELAAGRNNEVVAYMCYNTDRVAIQQAARMMGISTKAGNIKQIRAVFRYLLFRPKAG